MHYADDCENALGVCKDIKTFQREGLISQW
jgi:hypothetical protein